MRSPEITITLVEWSIFVSPFTGVAFALEALRLAAHPATHEQRRREPLRFSAPRTPSALRAPSAPRATSARAQNSRSRASKNISRKTNHAQTSLNTCARKVSESAATRPLQFLFQFLKAALTRRGWKTRSVMKMCSVWVCISFIQNFNMPTRSPQNVYFF